MQPKTHPAAMTQPARLYPLGEQDFAKIRNTGRLYIDKSAYVYNMTHTSSEYIFLSRPRRFGKSLLISTLQAYFEARRELFEGLAIEHLETEWREYPVIRLDMSMGHHETPDELKNYLLYILRQNEERFDIAGRGEEPNLRLSNLIEAVNKKTGMPVVVLIDEYDSPLLDVVHEDQTLPRLRNIMRNFYSPLKACSPHLRFVFLTGITKFSQLSIFSELNNIQNISMLPEYAAVCGITKEEMLTQMSVDIDMLALKLSLTREAMISALIEHYDGYHFTWPSPDIFNPYSLLSAMAKGELGAYWFGSGTPTFLIEMLRKFGTLPSKIGGLTVSKSDFDAPTESLIDITPLLYQSGYLTIKDGDSRLDIYTLDIPNKEIYNGLMKSLLPYYVHITPTQSSGALIAMYRAIDRHDMDAALRIMQEFLLTVPYTDNTAYEGHYQQVLYILFSLMNYYVDVEVHTAKGRVDLVMRTKSELYLIEVKLNNSAEAAMRQIDLNDYSARFATCGLPVIKVGMNFDQNDRTIKDWKIEPCNG